LNVEMALGVMTGVLAVIVIVLIVLARQIAGLKGLDSAPTKAALPAPAPVALPPAAVQAAEDDQEIMAAIAAALAVYLGTTAEGLVVRSIRRIGANAPSWNVAGRTDILNTRN